MTKEEMNKKNSRNNDKEKKPVVIADAYLYESISKAAQALGMLATHLSKALNAKRTSYKLREYNYTIAIRFATELDKKTMSYATVEEMDSFLLGLEVEAPVKETPKPVHKLGEPLIPCPEKHRIARCYP